MGVRVGVALVDGVTDGDTVADGDAEALVLIDTDGERDGVGVAD